MTSGSDQELVRQAMAGDAAAVEALWRAHRRFVAACLLAHARHALDLDDLMQEVALQMWTGVRRLRDPGRLRPWLRSVALNAARSHARKTEVRTRSVRPLEERDGELPDRSHAALSDELRNRVQEVLGVVERLPAEYREPLLLRAVEGLTQKQIAQALDLPETTVETRLARARHLLRRSVADEPRVAAPGVQR
jgi:RNA polymerase sigma-70 factor (ECF subfamily)